jgi:hypothetical protein
MGLIAEFEVGCEALPLVDVARAVPAATLTVQMVPHAKGHSPFIVRIHEGPAAAVEDAFRDSDFVAEYAHLGTDGDGETRRYQVIPAPDLEGQLGDHVDDVDGLRALSSEDATFDRLAVTPDGWRYTGWFADRATFDTFREFWQSEGHPFRLHRLTRDSAADDRVDALTDRQRAAVRVAYEPGYFEIPRNASLDDVAAELGISASSCSERLRRAQTALLEAHVDLGGRRRDPPRPGT